jgi:FkbM family methyltransferase
VARGAAARFGDDAGRHRHRNIMRKRPRLDLVEVLIVLAGVCVLAYFAGKHRAETSLQPFLSNGTSELAAFRDKYGPDRNSEHGEEWIVRDFFQDARGGVFVDVGANDHQRDSNTYYLESALGWSGIAIEPQTKFARDYARYRPRTRFVPLFASNVANRQVTLYVPESDRRASASEAVADTHNEGAVKTIETQSTTLDDILDRSGITHFDFLSVDVEEHEPEVLGGLTIGRFRPRLVCIEAHPAVRQAILDYFSRHQYVIVGKYLRADPENLWFTPAR